MNKFNKITGLVAITIFCVEMPIEQSPFLSMGSFLAPRAASVKQKINTPHPIPEGTVKTQEKTESHSKWQPMVMAVSLLFYLTLNVALDHIPAAQFSHDIAMVKEQVSGATHDESLLMDTLDSF